jgi:hypothetical protein
VGGVRRIGSMKRVTYKLSLRGIDTKQYEELPIVLSDWSYRLQSVVGTAKVLKWKTAVEVTYDGDQPEYKHSIGASVVDAGNYKYLVGLAVAPIIKPKSLNYPPPGRRLRAEKTWEEIAAEQERRRGVI